MPSEALAKEGRRVLRLSYREHCDACPRCIGSTADLKQRLQQHNAGQSAHTSKFKPWRVVSDIAFADRGKAEAYERYLKSGSGHAFAAKRLW
jgi:predicted GIY-YIG superfamily endonuclease